MPSSGLALQFGRIMMLLRNRVRSEVQELWPFWFPAVAGNGPARCELLKRPEKTMLRARCQEQKNLSCNLSFSGGDCSSQKLRV